MGVAGLLGLLKSIHRPSSLKDFRGKTIGVDAYGWLHRGAIACAADLALGRPTNKFVEFAMHRVRMLVHFGVIPYLVFDGDHLPSKAETEKSRAVRRRESLQLGQQLISMGKNAQAYQELQKAVDITPQLARQLIDELKRNNIPYIVAPYEADAQLAYLEETGIIHAVISEDSDLLVFGVKNLLTKLDQYGQCILIKQDDFARCREVNMAGWSLDEFRRMAILSGCDYLDSLHKMGLKTAHRIVRKYRKPREIIRGISLEGRMRVPHDYEARFVQAEMTFQYQWVFCPRRQELVHLRSPRDVEQLEGVDFIGAYVPQDTARRIASGDLCPLTKKTLLSVSSEAMKHKALLTPSSTAKACTPSIKTFFSEKRTPLREIDRNNFTPSPTQERILAVNHGRVWSPTMTASKTPSLAPDFSGTHAFGTRGLLGRKRLCRDVEDADEQGSPVKSKFFHCKNSESIPKPRPKNSTKRDFCIHSDDSLQDDVNELADSLEMSQQHSRSTVQNANPNMKAPPTQQEYRRSFSTLGHEGTEARRGPTTGQEDIVKTNMSDLEAPALSPSANVHDSRRAQTPGPHNMVVQDTPARCPCPRASMASEDLLIPDSEDEGENPWDSGQEPLNHNEAESDSPSVGEAPLCEVSASLRLGRYLYSAS